MNVFMAELFGTLLLVLLGCGVVANVVLKHSKAENSGWIVISLGWGFGVGIAVYAAGWVSGAHLNPAVTLGFLAIGGISAKTAAIYIAGQCVGAFLGAIVLWLAFKQHFDETTDPGLILAAFSTGAAIRNTKWNIISEAITTAVLMIGILAIFNVNNGIGAGFGPYAVGILVCTLGLCLGGNTGYAVNPARDLMPRIVHALLPIKNKGDSDWGYAIVPVVGPILGAVAGALLWQHVLIPVFTL
ncbi:Glycerol uptake facilitator protein [Vibrio stylophorae]|uniref:Glycerol uptake facilitator protein n=1 Tax=Vibrio stylophorae TaxID=659351 RepID=A0ABM8ZS81_9VIBR|nr:MIP/aquaporin family protein [Vibrio stylophorae]CAH0533107.1 Glycerol uptake facilitator protein [Vibrio stylophorae]